MGPKCNSGKEEFIRIRHSKLQPVLLKLVRTAPSETQAETEALKKKKKSHEAIGDIDRTQEISQTGK